MLDQKMGQEEKTHFEISKVNVQKEQEGKRQKKRYMTKGRVCRGSATEF